MLWAFDLMHLNGVDLRNVSLEDRKRRLAHLIERSAVSRLLPSEAFARGAKRIALRSARRPSTPMSRQ
jgi:ATP-dependent DNA ligase